MLKEAIEIKIETLSSYLYILRKFNFCLHSPNRVFSANPKQRNSTIPRELERAEKDKMQLHSLLGFSLFRLLCCRLSYPLHSIARFTTDIGLYQTRKLRIY